MFSRRCLGWIQTCAVSWGVIFLIAGLVSFICSFAIYKPYVDQKAKYWNLGNCTITEIPHLATEAPPTSVELTNLAKAAGTNTILKVNPFVSFWTNNFYYQSLLTVQYYNYVNYWSSYYYSNTQYYGYGYGYYDDEGSIPNASGFDDDGSEFADEAGADNDGSFDDGGFDGGFGGADGGDGGGGDDKKRGLAIAYNATYYYRPLYIVNLMMVNGDILYNQNATNFHLNNGWVYGPNAASTFTNVYMMNSTYPCWYNNQKVVLPAGENFAFFNYDISQRQQDFMGYLISGIVLMSLGAIALATGLILIITVYLK